MITGFLIGLAVFVGWVARRYWRNASPSISSDRDFCADWSEDGRP